MVFCCKHIENADKFIDIARSILNWNDDITMGDGVMGGLTIGLWTTVRMGNNLQEAENQMRKAYNALNDAKREIFACRCSEEREKELRRKKEQTSSTENQLKQLYEENSRQKLSIKEEELDRLISKLRINRDNKNEIKKLRDTYEKLFRAQKNDRRGENVEVQNDIETIKNNLLESEMDFDDWKKVRELCKEIAELKVQLEQEFIAQIQIPLRQF